MPEGAGEYVPVCPLPHVRVEGVSVVLRAEGQRVVFVKRFGKKGIIWILGGDRSADQTAATWRAMARGIAIGVNGKEDYTGLVMGFHPSGGGTSSRWFHEDPWLTVNMQQTGHGLAADVRSWERIATDYNRTPVKPVMDAEPVEPLSDRQWLSITYECMALIISRN